MTSRRRFFSNHLDGETAQPRADRFDRTPTVSIRVVDLLDRMWLARHLPVLRSCHGAAGARAGLGGSRIVMLPLSRLDRRRQRSASLPASPRTALPDAVVEQVLPHGRRGPVQRGADITLLEGGLLRETNTGDRYGCSTRTAAAARHTDDAAKPRCWPSSTGLARQGCARRRPIGLRSPTS